MHHQHYTATFTVDQTPEEAFAAIMNVREWWSEEIDGNTDTLGDEFRMRYQDIHYSKQKITTLLPGQKVVWLVLEANLNYIQDRSEWKGTEITFEISQKDDKTQVLFTHVGLVPQQECYYVCSDSWRGFINGSLRSLITTGKGQPIRKENKDEIAAQHALRLQGMQANKPSRTE
jgi:hypothetical protein